MASRTQTGKPNQNAYIEGFNRTCRDKVLNQHLSTHFTVKEPFMIQGVATGIMKVR